MKMITRILCLLMLLLCFSSAIAAEKVVVIPLNIKSTANFTKLHPEDELNLVMSSSPGPNVVGSSTDIGDISDYKGLMLEWRMNSRPEVFHQFIYLSDYDKDIILGNISTPVDYPRNYTTILSDGFGTIMWLGVSMQGTRLYLSTNSQANPAVKLQRIYSFK